MRSLPALPGRAVIAALERVGFEVIRTKGSHHFLRHRDDPSRQTVVPDIVTLCHLARFALSCGKRVSAEPSFSIFSERRRGGSGKLVEQRFSLLQIGRVEPLGEPIVDRREKTASFGGAAL